MHLFPADRGPTAGRSIEDVLALIERGARRVFECGCEEGVCHLLLRQRVDAEELTIVTLVANARFDWPWDLVRAARGAAAALECVAAVWVIPDLRREHGIWIFVERPDMTEETLHAVAGDLPRYALAEFERGPVRPADEHSYVCLPTNVIEYAARFGTDPDAAPYAPDVAELRNAERAVRAGARPGDAPAPA